MNTNSENKIILLQEMNSLAQRTAAMIFKYAYLFSRDNETYRDWSSLQADALEMCLAYEREKEAMIDA